MRPNTLPFLFLAVFLSAAPLGKAEARSFGTWAKAVKVTLGPRGRNVALDRASINVPGSIAGGRPILRPDSCYDYAFVSRRDRNVDNIFFANTCSPELREITNNTSNLTSYSSLAGSPIFQEVAAIEINTPDHPLHPSDPSVGPTSATQYLRTWTGPGAGSFPFLGFRDFLPLFPAYGPYGWFAMVTTGTNWRDAVVRRGDLYTYSAEAPAVVLTADQNGTRTLGRIAWIGAQDPSQPGYGKLIATVNQDGTDRLFVLDPSSGDLQPLKDPRDFANRDLPMEGREPAVGKDGEKLAFIRNVYGLNRLWTCDLTFAPAEGGGYQCANARMVTTDLTERDHLNGNYDWPCWSHDGRKIFFSFNGLVATSDSQPYSKICMADADGTDLQRLNDTNPDGTPNVDNDTYPACLPTLPTVYRAPATVQPYREPVQIYQEPTTLQPLPFQCSETQPCPQGMTCGSDGICRTP